MSLPHFDYDPPVIAGDHADDDARVIDSLVQEAPEPPKPEALPRVKPEPLPKQKPVNRVLTGSMNMQPGWDPVLLLPSDPNRKSLKIILISATSTDTVRVSDDSAKTQTLSGALTVPVFGGGVDIAGFTGPVWVYGPQLVAAVTISYVAVTE